MGVITETLRLKDEASGTLKGVTGEAKKTDDALDKTGKTGATSMETISTGAAGASVAVAAMAAAALTAAKGIANLSDFMSEFVDEVLLLSGKTGFAAETLIAMDFAAQAAGTSLSSMQTGLATLIKTAGDAADGNKEAADKFDALGVSVVDSSGKLKDADTILRDVLSGIGELGTDTEKAAAALDVFGARGAVVAVAFGDGGEALDGWSEKVTEAGLVLDRDLRQASTDADVAAADLALSLTALKVVLGEGLTPVVVEAKGAMAGLIDHYTLTIQKVEAIASVHKELSFIQQRMIFFTGGGQEALDKYRASIAMAETSIADFLGATEESTDATEEGSDAIDDAKTKTDELAEAQKRLAAAYKEATAANKLEMKWMKDASKLRESEGKLQEKAIKDAQSAALGMIEVARIAREAQAVAMNSSMVALGGGRGLLPGASSTLGAVSMAATGDIGGLLGMAGAAAGPAGLAATQGISALGQVGQLGAAGVGGRLTSFKDDLIAGLHELPAIIAEVIPEFIAELIPELSEAIIRSYPALIAAQARLLASLPRLFGEAMGDALMRFWAIAKEFFQNLLTGQFGEALGVTGLGGGLAADIGLEGTAGKAFGVGRIGLGLATFGLSEIGIAVAKGVRNAVTGDGKATGGFVDKTGLALIHQGERITPPGGVDTGSSMGGSAGVNITINGFAGPGVIDEMIRELNRHIGPRGRGLALDGVS